MWGPTTISLEQSDALNSPLPLTMFMDSLSFIFFEPSWHESSVPFFLRELLTNISACIFICVYVCVFVCVCVCVCVCVGVYITCHVHLNLLVS